MSPQSQTLDPSLLEILVCPESKQRLVYFADEGFLFCPASKLRYRIDEGIPVMLVDEATRLTEAEAAELVQKARARGLAHA